MYSNSLQQQESENQVPRLLNYDIKKYRGNCC